MRRCENHGFGLSSQVLAGTMRQNFDESVNAYLAPDCPATHFTPLVNDPTGYVSGQMKID